MNVAAPRSRDSLLFYPTQSVSFGYFFCQRVSQAASVRREYVGDAYSGAISFGLDQINSTTWISGKLQDHPSAASYMHGMIFSELRQFVEMRMGGAFDKG